jgi:hypothetical protein
MKRSSRNFETLLLTMLVVLGACHRDLGNQSTDKNTAQDPLAYESQVSVTSDYQMLAFDTGSSGDMALRDFSAATGCGIKINKLSFEIAGVKDHDLIIADHERMQDLFGRNQLLMLDVKRIRSMQNLDTSFKLESDAMQALQWSPMGLLERKDDKVTEKIELAGVPRVSGIDDLTNISLKSAAVSKARWQDLTDGNEYLKAAWQFRLPAKEQSVDEPEIYQMAINKHAKNINCSYALMEFLLTPRMQSELARQWHTLPVVKSACYGANEKICRDNRGDE